MKKGDPIIFFENSKESAQEQFWSTFYEVAGTQLGFFAIFYSGVGKDPPLNIEQSLQDDFERSKAFVAYFGESKTGLDATDNWALGHLKDVVAKHIPCLVYASAAFPREWLTAVGFDFEPTIVNSKDQFASALKRDLARLLTQ